MVSYLGSPAGIVCSNRVPTLLCRSEGCYANAFCTWSSQANEAQEYRLCISSPITLESGFISLSYAIINRTSRFKNALQSEESKKILVSASLETDELDVGDLKGFTMDLARHRGPTSGQPPERSRKHYPAPHKYMATAPHNKQVRRLPYDIYHLNGGSTIGDLYA